MDKRSFFSLRSLACVLLFLCHLQVVNAQQKGSRITLNLEQASIESFFRAVEQQVKYKSCTERT